LDSTLPTLSSVSGGGSTFYPYPDRYQDTFAPLVTLSERGTLTLTIKNSAGGTVRTLAASKAAGRRSLTWDGRNQAGKFVRAGKYHWNYSETDLAGNHLSTARYGVTVSSKRLVTKSGSVTIDGDSFYTTKRHGSISGCSGVSTANSTFGGGVLITNDCTGKKHVGVMATYHRFTLPAAVKYGDAKLQAYGFADHNHLPTVIGMIVYNPGTRQFEAARKAGAVVRNAGTAWRTVGVFGVNAHIDRHGVVKVSFGVINASGPADYDLGKLRLGFTYTVLK
jgi:hypothetical protein